jgi:hypothetical protein
MGYCVVQRSAHLPYGLPLYGYFVRCRDFADHITPYLRYDTDMQERFRIFNRGKCPLILTYCNRSRLRESPEADLSPLVIPPSSTLPERMTQPINIIGSSGRMGLVGHLLQSSLFAGTVRVISPCAYLVARSPLSARRASRDTGFLDTHSAAGTHNAGLPTLRSIDDNQKL